jgi:hypothetical protein
MCLSQATKEKYIFETWLFLALALIATVTVSLISLKVLLWTGPLCCADNTYIAVAAKNMAQHGSYSATFPVNGYFTAGYHDPAIYMMPFDPGISTGGPSQALSILFQLLVPTSLLAPDVAGIVTRFTLLVLIAFTWPTRTPMGFAFFLAMLVGQVSVAHLAASVLSTSMGDLTSAMFLIAGGLMLLRATERNSALAVFASAVLLYCAFLTKFIAISFLLAFAGLLLVISLVRRQFWPLLHLAGYGIFAIMAQQFVLLAVLGPQGYWENKVALGHFIGSVSHRSSFTSGFVNFLNAGYGDIATLLAASVLIATVLLTLGTTRKSFDIAAAALVSALLSLALGLTNASAQLRYAILPVATLYGFLCIGGSLIADAWLRACQPQAMKFAIPVASTIAVFSVALAGAGNRWMLSPKIFALKADTTRINDISALSAYIASLGENKLMAWSWQNAVDAEFVARRPGRVGYTTGRNPESDKSSFVLVNLRYTKESSIPSHFRTSCSISFQRGIYRVYKC